MRRFPGNCDRQQDTRVEGRWREREEGRGVLEGNKNLIIPPPPTGTTGET